MIIGYCGFTVVLVTVFPRILSANPSTMACKRHSVRLSASGADMVRDLAQGPQRCYCSTRFNLNILPDNEFHCDINSTAEA